ncbi:MAG TPA: DUF5916 domain-containing protein, partial [Gemmatimonadaceae bacterium]|nr:DUF5916 domain-containing protein [Gemmatimonadaceae bacterium]
MLGALLLALTVDPPTNPIYDGRAQQLSVSVPRIDASPRIDGDLSEDVWQHAALLTGFSQFSPQDKLPAADSTHVLIWYSPSALYVGIRAYEAHGAVHAALADRDRIAADDNVQLLIGTYHDRRQVYVFGVNPLGVQMDGTIVEQGQNLQGGWTPTNAGRAAPDLSQDFVFTSRGRLTPYGYEVEIRIPFKSLKYQASDTQTWDINVVRQVQHSGFEDSWAPAKRDAVSFLGQAGTLEGLHDLQRGLVLDATPIVTQYAAGAPSPTGWKYDNQGAQLGGNVRWGISNNLVLNGTARPDFAEVESDAGQFKIDPRLALYYPEKRPFFLEGLDQFATPHNLIYTRSIAKPDAAAELTGKVAGLALGVLSATDARSLSPTGRDATLVNVMRLQRDVGDQSAIGVAYTDRMVGGDYNRVLDVDGRVPFAGVYAAAFQWAQSFDREGSRYATAPLWEGSLARNGKHFTFRYVATGIADDFRARSGFISR